MVNYEFVIVLNTYHNLKRKVLLKILMLDHCQLVAIFFHLPLKLRVQHARLSSPFYLSSYFYPEWNRQVLENASYADAKGAVVLINFPSKFNNFDLLEQGFAFLLVEIYFINKKNREKSIS